MFRKLATALGLTAAIPAPAAADHADPATQRLYELLFCDLPVLYRPAPGAAAAAWQVLLFVPGADANSVRALAEDRSQESRVRALAYGWLREHGQPVPEGELLGVVVEVPLPGGLDTLAAYRDGRVRYLHHGGRSVLIDAPVPALDPLVEALLGASGRAMQAAQPWRRTGGTAPGPGQVRIAMLTPGGLLRNEGPFDRLQRDAAAGPALLAASRLLEQVVRSCSFK
jgi:hypothetical protein